MSIKLFSLLDPPYPEFVQEITKFKQEIESLNDTEKNFFAIVSYQEGIAFIATTDKANQRFTQKLTEMYEKFPKLQEYFFIIQLGEEEE